MIDIVKLSKYSKKIKLLYCEDNKEARESTLDFLQDFFDDIDVAIDGEDGYNKFVENSSKYDLIITDINMPKLTGIEMLDKIRDINTTIPAIIFSAYNEQDKIVNNLRLNVTGYLFKPIQLYQFVNLLFGVTQTFAINELKEEFNLMKKKH